MGEAKAEEVPTLETEEVEEEDFGDPDQLRDFPFLVHGHKIYVNVGLVASLSPVLGKMAMGASSEGVEIQGHSYEDMLELFRCICPHPTTKAVRESNVHLLLHLAAEFQMAELKRRCADFLERKLECPDEAGTGFELNEHWLNILILANKYELDDLLRMVFPRMAAQPLSALDELAKSGAMPPNIAAALYQAKTEKMAEAVVRASPHAFGERRFRVHGASRRRCDHCRNVFSSVATDKCQLCERILCPRDQGYKYCEFNVHRHCTVCLAASTETPKQLGPPFKVDKADPCHCGFTGKELPIHFLHSTH